MVFQKFEIFKSSTKKGISFPGEGKLEFDHVSKHLEFKRKVELHSYITFRYFFVRMEDEICELSQRNLTNVVYVSIFWHPTFLCYGFQKFHSVVLFIISDAYGRVIYMNVGKSGSWSGMFCPQELDIFWK